MKTTVPVIRRIIREELRRAIIEQAMTMIVEAVGSDAIKLLKEDIQKQQQIRKAGIGPYADVQKSTRAQDDVGQLMMSALQTLTNAKKDPKLDVGKIVKQLESLYGALQSSANTVHKTMWMPAVKNALDVIKPLINNPQHETRAKRMQFAQNKIQGLGKNVQA